MAKNEEAVKEAASNVTKISVGGEDHILRFGRFAVEEVLSRTIDNPSKSAFKIVADIIYAGISDESLRLKGHIPQYGQVLELVERLYDEPDVKEQVDRICGVFENTKHGKQLIFGLKEVVDGTEEPETAG